MFLAAAVLFSLLCWLLWAFVPRSSVRYSLLAVTGGIFVLAGLWIWFQQRQIFHFADEICDTLDALISGRQPEVERPYEDSVTAKVQGKLLQYYDIMNEGKVQSQRDKQTIQELVSDISHQVKTPIANIQMFTGILQQHQLTEEKRAEFLETMASQINKLDFLMQSLIKMSRLETGTFVLHMEEVLWIRLLRRQSAAYGRKQIEKISSCRWTAHHRSLCSMTPSGQRRPWAISWTTG